MNSTSYSDSIEKYNNSIRDLWKPEFENALESTENTNVKFMNFCFHVNQGESPVWFFGMNPSLPISPKEIISQDSDLTENLIGKLIEEQKNMHDEYQYFKKAKDFFKDDVGINELLNPIFHDLYPIRHTKQNEFERFIKDKSLGPLRESLDKATKHLIDKIMPDIIVIANAGASRLIKEIFFEGIDSNSTTLTYEQNGKKTDMIFSSMLSGQRALDTYSRSRLAREIRETWNSRNNK